MLLVILLILTGWVHASHMGVPLRYSDAAGQTLSAPSSYSVPGFPGQSQTFADLYYNRYRDYDSSTGRYIQADPIGLDGGASPYSYAMNNPLRFTDPTGEFVPAVIAFCLTPAGAVACGAVTGAVTDLAIQAGSNWWNGRDVFNEDCYDWSQVAMSGGIGGLTGGAGAWLLRGGRAAATAGGSGDNVAQVLINQRQGNAARDELADLLAVAGRDVRTDAYFKTPFGKRFVDIDVWYNGNRMGGIEVKTGGSRYRPHQRAKDFWLYVFRDYKVQLVRMP